jgi:anti-sigma B factor antagonist
MAAIRWRLPGFWRARRSRRPSRPSPRAPYEDVGRFAVALRAGEPVATLAVAGEIDIATTPRLEAEIRRMLDETTGPMLVDLGEVTFMDSTGLSLLLALRRDAGAAGRTLAIFCPEGPARLLFAVTGLESELPLYASREAALDALRAPGA